ncbi:MAG: hypothetical protein R3F53_21470 [Gammaproteobacteria bacterium]
MHQLAGHSGYVGLKTGIARDRVVASPTTSVAYNPAPEIAEALALTARTEGILLDRYIRQRDGGTIPA